MIQNIIVLLAVVMTLFFAIRGVVRTIKGKKDCCCQDCSLCQNKKCGNK